METCPLNHKIVIFVEAFYSSPSEFNLFDKLAKPSSEDVPVLPLKQVVYSY